MDRSLRLEWSAAGFAVLETYMKQFAGVYTYQDSLTLADVLFFSAACWSRDALGSDLSDYLHQTRVLAHLLKFEEFLDARRWPS